MLDRLQSQAPTVVWTAEHDTMIADANAEQEKARRFRDAALPYLDDVFALARYLMRNAADLALVDMLRAGAARRLAVSFFGHRCWSPVKWDPTGSPSR